MGIVNVTPDSFSDGGDFAESRGGIAHGWLEEAARISSMWAANRPARRGPVPAEEHPPR